jgi:hypothetical protein
LVNNNEGFCHPGCTRDFWIKVDVGCACFALFQENCPTPPSTRAVAEKAKASQHRSSEVLEALVLTSAF